MSSYFDELQNQNKNICGSLFASLGIFSLEDISAFKNQNIYHESFKKKINQNEVEEIKKTTLLKFNIIESISDYLHEGLNKDISYSKFEFRDLNFSESLPSIPLLTRFHAFVSDWQFIYLYSDNHHSALKINKFTFQSKFIDPKYKSQLDATKITDLTSGQKADSFGYSCGLGSAYLTVYHSDRYGVAKHNQHKDWSLICDFQISTFGQAVTADSLLNGRYVVTVNCMLTKGYRVIMLNAVSNELCIRKVHTENSISEIRFACIVNEFVLVIGQPEHDTIDGSKLKFEAALVDVWDAKIVNEFQFIGDDARDNDWQRNEYLKFVTEDMNVHLFYPLHDDDQYSKFAHYKFTLLDKLDKRCERKIEVYSQMIIEQSDIKEVQGMALYSILCTRLTFDGVKEIINDFKLLNKLNGIKAIVDEVSKQNETNDEY